MGRIQEITFLTEKPGTFLFTVTGPLIRNPDRRRLQENMGGSK